MDGLLILRHTLQVAVAAGVGWFILRSYQWIRLRSRAIGALFAAGVLIRALAGLLLFAISYLGLPVAESLQADGGFWRPAWDAAIYYNLGARTAEVGFGTLQVRWPSPVFIKILGAWMAAVGISPAAGLFLNICLYAALCRALVWLCAPVNDWRKDLPCLLAVVGLSFSPSLVIHATQPLKDGAFCFFLIVLCLAVLVALRPLVYVHADRSSLQGVLAGAVLIAAATFCLSGIRWYYGVMVWCSLASVLTLFLVVERTTSLLRYTGISGVLLIAVWLASWHGADRALRLGPDLAAQVGRAISGQDSSEVVEFLDLPSQLALMASRARKGFLVSGGETNVVLALREEQFPGTDEALGERTDRLHNLRIGMPRTLGEQLYVLAVGLTLVFGPVSLLKALSIVQFSGGGGLLAIADLDVIFLDVTMLLALGLLWKRRRLIGHRLPFVVFGLLLSGVTAVLLGYVVTNFGTLFRMRPLVALPVWVLVVAISNAPQSRPTRSG